MEQKKSRKIDIPIWKKSNLTLEEAAAYSGIGINRLRYLSDDEHCPFVLWIGTKRLIKRRLLDEYTDKMYCLIFGRLSATINAELHCPCQ